jgi:hypothetical protein
MPLTDIPNDQLDRITPIVETLRTTLQKLVKDLPFDEESALTFHPDGEDGE